MGTWKALIRFISRKIEVENENTRRKQGNKRQKAKQHKMKMMAAEIQMMYPTKWSGNEKV